MTLSDVVRVFQDEGWTLEYVDETIPALRGAAFRDGRGLPTSAYRRACVMTKWEGWILFVDHRTAQGYYRSIGDGGRRFQNADELLALLAMCGLQSIPFQIQAVSA